MEVHPPTAVPPSRLPNDLQVQQKEQSGEEVNRRIRLEAQILARLLPDNVVRIYDFGENNGTCGLAKYPAQNPLP